MDDAIGFVLSLVFLFLPFYVPIKLIQWLVRPADKNR